MSSGKRSQGEPRSTVGDGGPHITEKTVRDGQLTGALVLPVPCVNELSEPGNPGNRLSVSVGEQEFELDASKGRWTVFGYQIESRLDRVVHQWAAHGRAERLVIVPDADFPHVLRVELADP